MPFYSEHCALQLRKRKKCRRIGVINLDALWYARCGVRMCCSPADDFMQAHHPAPAHHPDNVGRGSRLIRQCTPSMTMQPIRVRCNILNRRKQHDEFIEKRQQEE